MNVATCRSHPRAQLPGADGDTFDLDDLRTQKLVLFVCPNDHGGAAEIADDEALLPNFSEAGAWIVGIAAAPEQIRAVPRHIWLALSGDGGALRDLAGWAEIKPRPALGATFVLERDGGLRPAWDACGHARDALDMVREGP